MATNKNAVIRYQTLDRCFRNTGRKYYIDDLIEACNEALLDIDPQSSGVKRRQVYDDIKFMKDSRGYDAPIESYREGKKTYHRYEDSNFSINNSPLNETEAVQLKNAISVLQRFEGAPQFEWINEIGPMLSSQFKLNKTEQKIMAYDSNIDYSGYENITPLFNAIVNRRVLDVVYEPFNKPEYKLTFHPYFLKQYNNRWFVFGLNAKLNIPIWNMALDRIKMLKEVDVKYKDNNIDWEDHFFDIIGVTTFNNCQPEEVELIFTKEQANYIYTKPLHLSQKAKFLEHGELLVKIKVVLNYELEMLLLSFGEKVKIVKPETLRVSIMNRIENALKQYNK